MHAWEPHLFYKAIFESSPIKEKKENSGWRVKQIFEPILSRNQSKSRF
jgi:hypothetical protein